MVAALINYFLHLDQYLVAAVDKYGIIVYALLFFIIFCETGLVFTPFLPGDSLLFAAGALAGINSLNIFVLFGLLAAAAILGDSLNYGIGHFFGLRAFKKNSFFFRQDYLDRTSAFYRKYGKKTIVIARFVPIVRTFAPFIAGICKMEYPQFIAYNIIGGLSWVSLFLFGGYFFGNISFVKANFEWVILAIIVLSVVPAIIEYVKHKKH